ncbi:Pro-apoptotic serine protease NMA111 [Ascoidea rubescens DSM 1968]|uniref:Pro-apoptotic serine protease NMA111 n=1 Tax=Ascoidea rubescens DSM 1968 TaxID=1344418 RepID=A0A1D2VC09_9ASCO|nr:Pro-apoptotic serine protease NMA111 [Ascoidea rubescens DSM 1968]ODV59007.1 Pro-apoptotic serine protease NMA111 [Ascoidea rubescens DSM 1968]
MEGIKQYFKLFGSSEISKDHPSSAAAPKPPIFKRATTLDTLLKHPAKKLTRAFPPPENITLVANETTQWQSTIERIVKSVVSIKFLQVEAFDTESRSCSEATGFIVDAELGIILTNRHVVGPGPFVGYAIFYNNEEIPLIPIYRDPIHDFGFLKFNPKEIKYISPLVSLILRPDLAKVGLEIRVVGNDNGEQLSILSGFISKLDRNTPEYAFGYNDFNTNYIQAATSSSSGSSGSPVIDITGNVVALQAGGSTSAATNFFLPLNRILRALKCIKKNEPITRGTIQTTWLLKPFDECSRLGLSSDAESKMRAVFPDITSLLVASTVLPNGPAFNKIKEGDTLISINDSPISTFIPIDQILDDNINKKIKIVVQRGNKNVKITCKVQDLHSITPSKYISAFGSVFNNLSYQIARLKGIPVRGVYAAEIGGCFDPEPNTGWIIDSFNNVPLNNVDDFLNVLKDIPHNSVIPFSIRHVSNLNNPCIDTVSIDRKWYKDIKLAVRNDSTGLWDFTSFPAPELESENQKEPLDAKFIDFPFSDPNLSTLSRSFVKLYTNFPAVIDGYAFNPKYGMGLIIDAQKGYVLASRYYVPHDMLRVFVIIANSIVLEAQVVFLHPTYNYSILKFDPSLVLAPIKTPKFSEKPLKKGDNLFLIGYDYNDLRAVPTKVTDILQTKMPMDFEMPRYKATNFESIKIDTALGDNVDFGILTDSDGTIRCIWLNFLGVDTDLLQNGIDITNFSRIINFFQNEEIGKVPKVRIIDAVFGQLLIADARYQGVSKKWIKKLEDSHSENFQFLQVSSVSCQQFRKNDSSPKLQVGDILLEINKKLITKLSDLDVFENDDVEFTIVRNGTEKTLKLKTTEVQETKEVISWCGASIQKPFHSVRQISLNLPSEVFVSSNSYWSPAIQGGLYLNVFIIEVNEIETLTFQKFLEVIKTIPDNTYTKLTIVSLQGRVEAISIKTNYHYFETKFYKKVSDKWENLTITE